MPLHPRSIGAGPYLRTASPDPAVNIALTAGLFALQPPIRIYAPYDRVSSVALKRLSILVVTGGVIKTALWNYRDIVFLKSPLDSDPVKFEAGSAGGFVVVRRGPGASAATAKYRKRRGGGQELAVGDALANISGEINNGLVNISPGIGLQFFGPFLDISGGMTVHSFQQGIRDAATRSVAFISKEYSISLNFAAIVAQGQCLDIAHAPLADVNPLDATLVSKELSVYLNFARTIAQGQCLEGFTVDESTMNDVFDHGVDSLSLREVPKSSSIVVFARPTSPFVYRSSNIKGEPDTTSSLALSMDGDRNIVEATGQHRNIDWTIYMVFGLGLIALLSLSLRYRRRNVAKSLAPAQIMRRVPYDPLPQYDLLEEQKLNTLCAWDGFMEYLGGCTCDQYVEVWYSKNIIDSVNKFVANGCQFVPKQSEQGSGLSVLLCWVSCRSSTIVEFIKTLVMLLLLARFYLSQEYFLRIIEIIAVFVLLAGVIRYFRPRVFFRRFVKLKRRKRRRGRRNKMISWECFGPGPQGAHIPDALKVCSTGFGDDGSWSDVDYGGEPHGAWWELDVRG